MKIQIVGYSGSGKSTLAKQLGEMYNIPVLHLDTAKYRADGSERTDEEKIAIVQKFLDENDSWVIDGNYKKTCPERFEMSDMTIFLKLNRFVCYFSAKKRAQRRKTQPDDDFPCEDKFDKEFRKWVFWQGRTRERTKMIYDCLNMTKGKKIVLKTRRQINKFLENCKKEIEK